MNAPYHCCSCCCPDTDKQPRNASRSCVIYQSVNGFRFFKLTRFCTVVKARAGTGTPPERKVDCFVFLDGALRTPYYELTPEELPSDVNLISPSDCHAI